MTTAIDKVIGVLFYTGAAIATFLILVAYASVIWGPIVLAVWLMK